eukprot:TRINITY_DN3015_c1_g4_i2.p1 TRINITY_DN3015_c1_g4~~TRINITY_DN3015_c1_g4_i2.p1  ORF type:complete len:410 (+),score=86.21 TRINITY_DN3015_c1_g4_i2:807-2036(+)
MSTIEKSDSSQLWDDIQPTDEEVGFPDHTAVHDSALKSLLELREVTKCLSRKRRLSEAVIPRSSETEVKLDIGIITEEGHRHGSFETDMKNIYQFHDTIKEQERYLQDQLNSNTSASSVAAKLNVGSNDSLVEEVEDTISLLMDTKLREDAYHLSSEGALLISQLQEQDAANTNDLSLLQSQLDANKVKIQCYQKSIADLDAESEAIKRAINRKTTERVNNRLVQTQKLMAIKAEWAKTNKMLYHNQKAVEHLANVRNEMIAAISDMETLISKEFSPDTISSHERLTASLKADLKALYKCAEEASNRVKSFVEGYSDDKRTKKYHQHKSDVDNARKCGHYHCLSQYVEIVDYLTDDILSKAKEIDLSNDCDTEEMVSRINGAPEVQVPSRFQKIQFSDPICDPLPKLCR